MAAPMQQVHDALRARGSKRQGNLWQCPAHQDRTPSLSVDANGDGDRVLVNCLAGCETAAVLDALGLSMRDLYDNDAAPLPAVGQDVEYVYTDADGVPLYRVRRTPDKAFFQARYGPDDPAADVEGYVSGKGCMTGVQRVLYRLPQVVAAVQEGRPVYLVEGEKDADNLAARGHAATTSPEGAGKWSRVADHAREVLAGAQVVVVQDKDDPGRAHAQEVAASLAGRAASVQVVEAREGKDMSDHLGAGLTVDALVEVVPASLEPSRQAWELVDPFADPGDPPPPPELLRGLDGTALVYRGGRVLFSGEPGVGKTWAGLCLAVQVMQEGGKVAWLDSDAMGAGALVERLRLLGVSDEDGSRLMRYSLARDEVSLEDLRALAASFVADGFALVVLDSWDPALVLAGLEPNDNADVNKWHNALTSTLHAGGVTLALLDHVPKSKERNRRFSAGAGAKLRPVEIHLEVQHAKGEQLGRGTDGGFLLTCRKDRHGHVPEGSTYRLNLAHQGDGIAWDVTAGSGEYDPNKAPTGIMEKVSRLLEMTGEQSGNQIRQAKLGKRWEDVQRALGILVMGGYVQHRQGARNAQLYSSARPFRDGDELPEGMHS